MHIGCSFYKTPGTKLGQIDKTITILPGSGEQHYGAVNKNNQKDFKHTLPKDTNVNDGCLVIVPFRRDENLTDDDKKNNVNMYRHPDRVFSTVLLGNYFANGSTNESKHVKNSIVGYSFGAYVAGNVMMRRPEIETFVLISPLLNKYNFSFISPCLASGAIIIGENDDFTTIEDAEKLVTKMNESALFNTQLITIPDANHLYKNCIEKLCSELEVYINIKLATRVAKPVRKKRRRRKKKDSVF